MGSSSFLRLLYNPQQCTPSYRRKHFKSHRPEVAETFAEVMRCMSAISGAKHTLLCSSKKEG